MQLNATNVLHHLLSLAMYCIMLHISYLFLTAPCIHGNIQSIFILAGLAFVRFCRQHPWWLHLRFFCQIRDCWKLLLQRSWSTSLRERGQTRQQVQIWIFQSEIFIAASTFGVGKVDLPWGQINDLLSGNTISSVPPNNSHVSVSDPSKAYWAATAPFKGP